MTVNFRPLNEWTDADFAAYARWDNDPEIRHLFIPCFNPSELEPEASAEYIKKLFLSPEERSWPVSRWMIDLNGKPVGNMTLALDCPVVLSPLPGVAWLSMVLGERSAWGTGVAQMAFEHLLQECRDRGAKRAELGVFAFNERARKFYHHFGFQEFASIPCFTWWSGECWPDIRMIREL